MTHSGTAEEQALIDSIKELETLARLAQRAKAYPPAVSARTKIARLRSDLAVMREARRISAIEDDFERLRELIALAIRSGSHQAGAAYQRKYNELLVEKMRADAATAAGEMRDLTPEDLLAVIEGLVADLPIELLRRLATAIESKTKPRLATA